MKRYGLGACLLGVTAVGLWGCNGLGPREQAAVEVKMSRLHNDLEIAQLEVRDAKLQQEIQRRQHRQVDARPLETARAHVRDAEANLRAAQSNLRAALDGHIKGCEQVL